MKIIDGLQCPRQLDKDEISKINFNEYSVDAIHFLIDCGAITNQDVIDFYNNEWWDERP